MLMSSVFPLAPNHSVRCFWALCQLILFCGNAVLSGLFMGIALMIFTFLALLLAVCDTLSCFGVVLKTGFSQQHSRPPDHEAEPLLHRNRQTWSCCKDMLYKYNDLLRLVVAELATYLILVTTLIYSNTILIYMSVSIFGVCVYVIQFLFFVKLAWTLWRQLKPLRTTRCKAMCLLLWFLLHFVGYRILQTLSLVNLALVYK